MTLQVWMFAYLQGLAAFLKAIGYLIPLMDAEYANYYTREVMLILKREFQSPDEEMKKIVLKVVKQCCATDGVEPQYIKDEILPAFFKHFWNQRMALDRRNYRQVVELFASIKRSELAKRYGRCRFRDPRMFRSACLTKPSWKAWCLIPNSDSSQNRA